MFRPLTAFLLFALLLRLPAVASAQDAGDAVTVGSSASVNSLTIQGENIYLDGVLQKEKYKPGMDVVIRDGKAAVVPRDPAAEARKSAERTARKSAEREARKAADKATRTAAEKAASEREKEALKAQLKLEKEAVKAEAFPGAETETARVEMGAVANKGGAFRLGDRVSREARPGTDADIPPETRRLIENARKMNQAQKEQTVP